LGAATEVMRLNRDLIFSHDLEGCRFVLLDLSFISVYFQGFIEVGFLSHV
jgi:hypothetical protein